MTELMPGFGREPQGPEKQIEAHGQVGQANKEAVVGI